MIAVQDDDIGQMYPAEGMVYDNYLLKNRALNAWVHNAITQAEYNDLMNNYLNPASSQLSTANSLNTTAHNYAQNAKNDLEASPPRYSSAQTNYDAAVEDYNDADVYIDLANSSHNYADAVLDGVGY